MSNLTILQGDALAKLRELPDASVHCCVTSPPYWGLRDYGTGTWEGGDADCDHLQENSGMRDKNILGPNGHLPSTNSANLAGRIQFKETCGKCGARRIDSQLGLEKTPEEYVAKMVERFREVRRVLRKDGTLWLNMGDSYASSSACDRRSVVGNGSPDENCKRPNRLSGALKEKDLCGIPWRLAFALQADGWWLRQDIIWAKPNPMPESVTDRCTKSHEYLFLLTKSASYFYDAEAIKEPAEFGRSEWNGDQRSATKGVRVGYSVEPGGGGNRNKRSVWSVATAPYPEAHFATYPPDLIKPCILAGTSAKGCCAKCGAPWERVVEVEKPPLRKVITAGAVGGHGLLGGNRFDEPIKVTTTGWQPTCKCHRNSLHFPDQQPCTVLDPFGGSGTTGQVALELGRKAVLIELNPKYVDLIKRRCDVTPGLALA